MSRLIEYLAGLLIALALILGTYTSLGAWLKSLSQRNSAQITAISH